MAAETLDVAFTRSLSLPPTIGKAGEPLVVMPFIDTDQAHRAAVQLASRAGVAGRLLCVHDVKRDGFIAVANAVFRRSIAPYFAYVAQDAFAGRKWLNAGLQSLQKKDGVLLAFNDGKWMGSLAAFGLVERDWAQANYDGDLFFPGYKRHYADAELTLLAMQQKKFRFDPLAILVEVDWQKEASPVDDADRILYYKRGQTAFDRKVTDAGLRRLFG